MDIQTLKTFITLAETKSYTKTANQLFVAQSTVTNRINELEKELKLSLFSRTNRSVQLTTDGERFKIYAEKVLDLTENTLAEMSAEHRFANHIRIGSADSIYEGHLAPQIKTYRDKYPENSLKITIGYSNHLLEMLQEDIITEIPVIHFAEKKKALLKKRQAEKLSRLEYIRIPASFDYSAISSLSIESRQKLNKYRPETIAQASRIPGVSPADISVLLVYFGR